MPHKNALSNDEPHHLYEIVDKTDNDTFKFGISGDPIEEDGLSRRVRRQVNLLNLVDNWARFFARILVFDIQGRKEAARIEKEYIQNYKTKYGRKPRGNPKD